MVCVPCLQITAACVRNTTCAGEGSCSKDGDISGTWSWPRLPAASFPSPPVLSCLS